MTWTLTFCGNETTLSMKNRFASIPRAPRVLRAENSGTSDRTRQGDQPGERRAAAGHAHAPSDDGASWGLIIQGESGCENGGPSGGPWRLGDRLCSQQRAHPSCDPCSSDT